jgi:hypothetical protein
LPGPPIVAMRHPRHQITNNPLAGFPAKKSWP